MSKKNQESAISDISDGNLDATPTTPDELCREHSNPEYVWAAMIPLNELDMSNMKHFDADKAGRLVDARMRMLGRQAHSVFLEMGLIAKWTEKRELWKAIVSL